MKIDLKKCKQINRREALLMLQKGEELVCRTESRKNERTALKPEVSEEIFTISSMEKLQKVVLQEQRGLYDKVEFFKN